MTMQSRSTSFTFSRLEQAAAALNSGSTPDLFIRTYVHVYTHVCMCMFVLCTCVRWYVSLSLSLSLSPLSLFLSLVYRAPTMYCMQCGVDRELSNAHNKPHVKPHNRRTGAASSTATPARRAQTPCTRWSTAGPSFQRVHLFVPLPGLPHVLRPREEQSRPRAFCVSRAMLETASPESLCHFWENKNQIRQDQKSSELVNVCLTD